MAGKTLGPRLNQLIRGAHSAACPRCLAQDAQPRLTFSDKKMPGDNPRLFGGPSREDSGRRGDASGTLIGLLAKVTTGGLPPALESNLPKEHRGAYNTLAIGAPASCRDSSSTPHQPDGPMSHASLESPQTSRGRRKALCASLPHGLASATEAYGHLQQVLADLLEVVLFEAAPVAEEKAVCRPGIMSLKLHRGKLKGADVVGQLEKTVVFWRGVFVDDRVFCQNALDCRMERVGDNCLAVVVVDLDFVEGLEIRKMLVKEEIQVALHFMQERIHAGRIGFFIGKRFVAEGKVLREDGELREHALSIVKRGVLVVLMSVQERPHMERDVWYPAICQNLSIANLMAVEVGALIMQDKGDEIKPGPGLVPGFVDKDRQLAHCANPPIYKKCRGTTPGSGRPPFARRRPPYTTPSTVIASTPYSPTACGHPVRLAEIDTSTCERSAA